MTNTPCGLWFGLMTCILLSLNIEHMQASKLGYLSAQFGSGVIITGVSEAFVFVTNLIGVLFFSRPTTAD